MRLMTPLVSKPAGLAFRQRTLAVLMLLGMGLCVLYVKYRAADLRRKTHILRHQKHQLKKDVQLLQLEWAALTSPHRLETLAQQLLPALRPPMHDQLRLPPPPRMRGRKR